MIKVKIYPPVTNYYYGSQIDKNDILHTVCLEATLAFVPRKNERLLFEEAHFKQWHSTIKSIEQLRLFNKFYRGESDLDTIDELPTDFEDNFYFDDVQRVSAVYYMVNDEFVYIMLDQK